MLSDEDKSLIDKAKTVAEELKHKNSMLYTQRQAPIFAKESVYDSISSRLI